MCRRGGGALAALDSNLKFRPRQLSHASTDIGSRMRSHHRVIVPTRALRERGACPKCRKPNVRLNALSFAYINQVFLGKKDRTPSIGDRKKKKKTRVKCENKQGYPHLAPLKTQHHRRRHQQKNERRPRPYPRFHPSRHCVAPDPPRRCHRSQRLRFSI